MNFLGQGHSEGTLSVAFDVLIINYQIYFINLFILNCLTLNIKLFIFNLFDIKLFIFKLFYENHTFCKQETQKKVYIYIYIYIYFEELIYIVKRQPFVI